MKPTELREMGIEGLDQRIAEVSKELATMRIKHRSGGQLEKPGQLKNLRREIARMKTIRTELEAKK